MARVRLALFAAIACVLAIAVGLVAAGRRSGAPGDVSASTGFAGALRPPGMPPARFALRDQDGRLLDARSLRGHPAVVTFMYSTCRDTCPLTADQIRGALDRLPRPVPVVVVSVAPGQDTPLNIKRFLARHGLTGRARYLNGSSAQLQRVWREFGIQPQTPRYSHSASTVLLDARGVQRVGFPTSELTPEGLAHDLRRLGA